MVLSYRVPDGISRKLSGVLSSEMELSSTMIRRLKRVQGIFVDGVPRYTNYVLSGGETVTVDLSLAEPPCDIVPQDGEVNIIFENDGILAVNKLPGMLTHPSRAQYTDTLANFVSGYLERSCGDMRCHPVNRLDRGTSGIVLFSKNSHYMDRAISSLKAENAYKKYLAVVLGAFDEPDGTIDLPIFRPDARDIKRIVDERGQHAVTHYHTVAVSEICDVRVSLLSLVLETGRTHQIRVHCSHLGHPILGDRLYFSEGSASLSQSLGFCDQLLHASELGFTDPVSGNFLALHADITRSDMLSIINKAFK